MISYMISVNNIIYDIIVFMISLQCSQRRETATSRDCGVASYDIIYDIIVCDIIYDIMPRVYDIIYMPWYMISYMIS